MDGFAWLHLGALLLMMVMLPLMMWSVWLARRRAVRAGGRLLLAALRPRYRRWALLFFVVLSLDVAAEWLSYISAGPIHVHPSSVANSTLMLIAAFAIFHMGGAGWRLEFCEAGIVDHALFAAWHQIREFRWVDASPVLLVWYRGRGPVQYGIAVEQRQAIDELLRAHVSGSRGVSTEPPRPA